MEVFDAIKQRRTVRRFLPTPVERKRLERIVTAAGYAPSGADNQSWNFVIVTDEALERLRIQVRDFFRTLELTSDMPPFFGVCKERALADDTWSFFYNAPALFIVANKKNYRNAMADSAAATMCAMLEATSQGLSTGWITTLSGNTNHPQIRKSLTELGIPEDYDVCASMSIGYGAEAPVPSERKYTVAWATT